jgi:YD repeat-containing protein
MYAISMFGQTVWSDADFMYSLGRTDFKAKSVVPPSPEAAELGKYGNVPVSLFTGTPKVSIPLYELKGSSLSLPISLSYNSTGFKPQDIATWTGLGWSLNAGGVVTRAVAGNPDLQENYYNTTYNYNNIPAVTDLYGNYDYYHNVEKGLMETQPDTYFYNFGNYSGKFLINTGDTIIRKQKDNLKISYCLSCNPNTLTITDEKGVVYQFSDVETSIEQVDDQVDPNNVPEYMSYVFPSTWFLTSMTSADATEQILFTYYTTDSLNTMFNTGIQNQSASYSKTTLNCIGSCTWQGGSINYGAPPYTQLYRKYLKRATLVKSGLTISYVDFVSGVDLRQDLDHLNTPEERLLQSIQVHDANSALVRQLNLSYSYFSGGSTYYYKRLRLDSLQEIPVGAATPKPPYKFLYSGSSVPHYLASIDGWGYYNGGSTGPVTYLVPNQVVETGVTLGLGANRNPDFNSASTAILTQITYPTGGHTSFIYEGNDAGNITAGTATPIGGVRIKQIIDYSFATQQATAKNYSYLQDNNTSSGVSVLPTYSKFSTCHNFLQPQWSLHAATPDYTVTYFTISASSIYGLGSLAGSHVGYSQVIEYQSDVNTGSALGKTVYKYNVGRIDPFGNDDASSGDLLEQTTYDIGGKILYDETNTYNYPGYNGIVGYRVMPLAAQDNHSVLCLMSNGGGYEWLGGWDVTTGCSSTRNYITKKTSIGYIISGVYKQLTQNVKKVYDQTSNSYSVFTSKYTYSNLVHNLPTMIEQYSSNSDEIVTSKTYSSDYTPPSSGGLDAATTGLKLLLNKNIVGAEVEKLQFRQNLNGTNKRYISGGLNLYSATLPTIDSVYRMELSTPLTTIVNSTTNGHFTYDPNYKLAGSFVYDGGANLIEQSKPNDAVKSYIWDYNYSLPTAEVINANASMIAYSGFELPVSGGNWVGIILSQVISPGVGGSYSYNFTTAGTITKTSLPSGRQYIVSYWSKNGAVTVVSNTGSATGTAGAVYNGWTYYEHKLPVSSTSVTLSVSSAINIDELRLYPKDALMSSITYKPLIGETSKHVPTGQFESYQYDGLGRLINVLDMSGNIVKNYKYNYGPGAALSASPQTIYYSSTATGNFTKTCPAGTTSTTVTYQVIVGKYVSSVSQADADAKGAADVAANGPAYATANCQCLYYNVLASSFYFKNDCVYSQGLGSRVTYSVAANTYSSLISQADADSKAQADLTANGQTYANAHGICSCGSEGHKYINGVCTTGTRFNSSTTHMPDGTWQCVYYYSFSDNTVSQNYTVYGASPCSIQ